MSAFVPIYSIALASLAVFAISLFSKDKIAYVFSSTQDTAQMAAMLVQNHVEAQAPLFEMLVGNFNFALKKFPEQSRGLIQTNENLVAVKVEALQNGRLQLFDSLGQIPEKLVSDQKNTLADFVRPQQVFFFKNHQDYWGVSRFIRVKGYQPEEYRLTMIFKKNPLKSIFESAKYYDLFVVGKDGNIFATPKELNNASASRRAQNFVLKNLNSAEIPQSKDLDSFLQTWHPIAQSDYGIVSVTHKSKVTQAIDQMKQTSWGVLFLLLSLGLVSALIVIRSLTSNIESLTQDMQTFSSGRLDQKSKVQGNDELGTMAKVFNRMTEQIQSLISQTASQARMETELETARRVQQQFLPRTDFSSEQVEICGYCESASECGGDWWTYDVQKDFCRVIIADVTGHGVAPAMLTAALHAGVSALRDTDLSLVDYVKSLNKVICSSSSGDLVLSMFIAELKFHSDEVSYVNASHCAGVVIHAEGEERVSFLSDIGGPHLGRNLESEYRSSTFKMKKGDRFFLYTDGLVEFANDQGRMYGERRLVKSLSREMPEGKNLLKSFRDGVLQDFATFRKSGELPDDVTLVTLERKSEGAPL